LRGEEAVVQGIGQGLALGMGRWNGQGVGARVQLWGICVAWRRRGWRIVLRFGHGAKKIRQAGREGNRNAGPQRRASVRPVILDAVDLPGRNVVLRNAGSKKRMGLSTVPSGSRWYQR